MSDMNTPMNDYKKFESPVIYRSFYPERKELIPITEHRYTESDFKKFNEMALDTDNIKNCRIVEGGRNYKTNRKIKIDGKLYRKLMLPFYVRYSVFHHPSIFTDLCDINEREYFAETARMDAPANEQNLIIREYNKGIDEFFQKLHSLEKWNDYVMFKKRKMDYHLF